MLLRSAQDAYYARCVVFLSRIPGQPHPSRCVRLQFQLQVRLCHLDECDASAAAHRQAFDPLLSVSLAPSQRFGQRLDEVYDILVTERDRFGHVLGVELAQQGQDIVTLLSRLGYLGVDVVDVVLVWRRVKLAEFGRDLPLCRFNNRLATRTSHPVMFARYPEALAR